MQIVIDIPEKVNNRLRSFLGHGYTLRDEDVKIIADAIYNGQTELEALANTSNTLNALNCIDRQEAIDALQKEINKGIPPFDDVMGSIRCGVRLARNIIEDLPSAQTEIIRCIDCKYWDGKVQGGFYYFEHCSLHNIDATQDDFCSCAERKEE